MDAFSEKCKPAEILTAEMSDLIISGLCPTPTSLWIHSNGISLNTFTLSKRPGQSGFYIS